VKITSIQTKKVAFEHASPLPGIPAAFNATYGTIGRVENVFVKVATDEDGLYGVGEAMNFFIKTPARRHLRPKETAETVTHVIGDILAPQLVGQDPLDVDRIHTTMEGWLSGHRSAKAAIGTAVYDIVGKYCRMPLYRYLGGAYRTEFPGLGGVPLGRPEDMAKTAQVWIENGWVGFQMKVGGSSPDPDMDVARVKAVRDAVGSGPVILADFNQAYRPDAAIRLLRRLEGCDVYAEQPTFAYDLDGMAKIARSVGVPVVADESLSYGQPVRNLIEMIENGGTYAIKLKCMPIGGTYTQRRLIDIAREYELPVITDADGPVSRVTDTALAHATATLNDDLFFPTLIGQTSMLLTPDVLKSGGLEVSRGRIRVPDGPGLGLEVADWLFQSQ